MRLDSRYESGTLPDEGRKVARACARPHRAVVGRSPRDGSRQIAADGLAVTVKPMGVRAADLCSALGRVVAELPGGGEDRPGQRRMAEEVAEAIASGRHLLVQAGTGTGKSLAYLVPALLTRRPVVVATATKALQEQLVDHDLPFLRRTLGLDFTWALLKGRSNYLCRAALADAVGGSAQGVLLDGPGIDADQLDGIVEWEATTPSGDRADLPFAVTNQAWGSVSVSAAE